MNQKKAPVTLLAAVVVMVLVGGIVNATGFLQDPGRFFRKAPEAPKEVAPKELTDAQKEQNKQSLQAAARSRGSGRPDEDGMEMVNGVPKDPSILIPDLQVTKPQVNDSNISAQWYREESRQKKMTEEKERERQAAGS